MCQTSAEKKTHLFKSLIASPSTNIEKHFRNINNYGNYKFQAVLPEIQKM